jgi:NTP pyrophosphatase (non-canonical NTP hydrolase)
MDLTMSEDKRRPWDLKGPDYVKVTAAADSHEQLVALGWTPGPFPTPRDYTLKVGAAAVCRLHFSFFGRDGAWMLTNMLECDQPMWYLKTTEAMWYLDNYLCFARSMDEHVHKEAQRLALEMVDARRDELLALAAQESADQRYARMLDELAEVLHQINVSKGFSHRDNPFRGLMLIITEVTEAADALRSKCKDMSEEDAFRAVWMDGGKEEGVAVELADTIVRALSLCKEFGLPIGEILMRKVAYNRTRPFKHGKAF